MTLNYRPPNAYTGPKGTNKKMGLVRLATDAEAAAATANDVALTPAQGVSSVPAASTTVAGKVELATSAECVTGTDAERAVVPSGLTARLAAPGAIGGTTPAAGTFTTVAAGTTVTAGTDLISTAGNVLIQGAGKQLRVEGGAATDFIGTATLVLGTVTVLNTNIAAGDRIFLQRIAANASTLLGELSYVINAGVSFVITALETATPGDTEVGDVSTVAYFIVRQL